MPAPTPEQPQQPRAAADAPASRASTSRYGELRWWKEGLLILGFYLIYGWIRNQFGSAAVHPSDAFRNAGYIIDLEASMGLDVEESIQNWFLDWGWFLRLWNIFYGTFHFMVTAFALVYLYKRDPIAYPRWRTMGLATTGLGLVGFAAFPLMPPRLLGSCGKYGACIESAFVDTVEVHGGWWTFGSGTVEELSNQYAAMPSLHFAWAFWSFLILAPRLVNRCSVTFMWAYPWLTLFAIVVTANHYWIDAVGGALALIGGWYVAMFLHRPQPGEATLPTP